MTNEQRADKIIKKYGTALALLLALSSFLLLVGCKAKKNLPFYQFEIAQNSVLTVDGVRYSEDSTVLSQYEHTGLFWRFTGEIGDAIGVCGGDNAEHGGDYDVCEIEGDEEHCFLYVQRNQFVFGPHYTYFFAREDLQMVPPTTETVSSIEVVFENEESASVQVDDPTLIAALLEVFNDDSVQAPNFDGCRRVSLITNHKDFPFLQCKIKCYYLLEQKKAYCRNKNRDWLVLPAEWCEIISEHDFSPKDE